MKYFTEITEGLLKEIEEKSNTLWNSMNKPTEYKPIQEFICVNDDGTITCAGFNRCTRNEFIPLTSERFLEKCIELNPKKKSKWVPKHMENYLFIDLRGNASNGCNTEHEIDTYLIKANKAFKTKEICELSKELELARAEYENAVREFNGDWVPDWGDSNKKWEINLNICDCVERSYIYHLRCVETAHFKSDPMASENWEEIKQLYLNYYNAKQAFEKAKREV